MLVTVVVLHINCAAVDQIIQNIIYCYQCTIYIIYYDRLRLAGTLTAGCDECAAISGDTRESACVCICAFARDERPRETVKIEFARQTPAGRPANRFGRRAAASANRDAGN